MNRKQEIVMWIVGTVVAAVCLYNGAKRDWLFTYVIPIMILGGLVFHRLRSPSSRSPSPTTVVSALTITALLVVLHEARHALSEVDVQAYEIESVGSRVDDVESTVEDLTSTVHEVESSVEDVKSTVDGVESRIDNLEFRVSLSH